MKIILPLIISCGMASCTTYQIMTVSSQEAKQINKGSEWVVENDSLEIAYNFNGQDGPIRMKITNKLNKPVYVDWKRSALVVNDRAVSYGHQKVEINGVTGGSTYSWSKKLSTTSSYLHATADIASDIEFMPPHSYVTKELPGITNLQISNVPDSVFEKKKVPVAAEVYNKIKEAHFTSQTSPLVFKSYLTVVVGDSTANAVGWEHNFYVSELVKTDVLPEQLDGSTRADRFYVSSAGGSRTGYGVIRGTALIPHAEIYRAAGGATLR